MVKERYQETFRSWNKVAQLYQDKFMDLELYNESYDWLLAALVKRDASILELGCGPGNISKYLLGKNPALLIKGIDISENMIGLARKNNPLAHFEVMDIRKLGQLNTSFDAIVGGFCIPYCSEQDVKKLIENCRSLLLPNGLLYLSFVAGDYQKSGFIAGSTGDRSYFYYHEEEVIKAQLIAAGFTVLHRIYKKYRKSETQVEEHTILITKC
ncbi:MAG: class I SAM-dependent methyltransferase [Saprospiraceae bacterium]